MKDKLFSGFGLSRDMSRENLNHIDGVMVRVIASSVVDRRFEPRSSQTKDFYNLYLLFLQKAH
jgi:hypothetical protein